jgi:Spy/CpxP family protein refolding chaperone
MALDNKERWVMRTTAIIIGMLMLGLSPVAATASDSADAQKTDRSKGITVEDLGHSLKSAEQNIEREIPKIGPAIIDTFKKITGKESEKQSSQSPEKQKK